MPKAYKYGDNFVQVKNTFAKFIAFLVVGLSMPCLANAHGEQMVIFVFSWGGIVAISLMASLFITRSWRAIGIFAGLLIVTTLVMFFLGLPLLGSAGEEFLWEAPFIGALIISGICLSPATAVFVIVLRREKNKLKPQ
jgi:hypothetical protein